MTIIPYSLNAQPITLYLNHRARKNIIIKPHTPNSLNISVPKWLSIQQLLTELDKQPQTLLHILKQANTTAHHKPPEELWFNGTLYPIKQQNQNEAHFNQSYFTLPQHWCLTQQQTWLKNFLFQAASRILLPKLAHHSQILQLIPPSMKLSNAKTYWGICRAKTGIRLNWRLIGAPSKVQDYVCIHELCHLIHPNHSSQFWASVHHKTPHAQYARTWLKQNGQALFALG